MSYSLIMFTFTKLFSNIILIFYLFRSILYNPFSKMWKPALALFHLVCIFNYLVIHIVTSLSAILNVPRLLVQLTKKMYLSRSTSGLFFFCYSFQYLADHKGTVSVQYLSICDPGKHHRSLLWAIVSNGKTTPHIKDPGDRIPQKVKFVFLILIYLE